MTVLKILPARGEGDRPLGGGGGLRPCATAAGLDSPLRQSLRACHLPTSGEDLA